MRKVLFLILAMSFASCSQPTVRQESDCEYTCSAIANKYLETAPQGCICQNKEQK